MKDPNEIISMNYEQENMLDRIEKYGGVGES
jgi:hypothetical protein